MARTPLMHMLKRATRRAAFERRAAEGTLPPAGGAVSRRDVLAGAAATGAALFVPLPSLAQETMELSA